MTTEQHVRMLIGDLLIRVAQLAAENDELRLKLAVHEPPPDPRATSGQPISTKG